MPGKRVHCHPVANNAENSSDTDNILSTNVRPLCMKRCRGSPLGNLKSQRSSNPKDSSVYSSSQAGGKSRTRTKGSKQAAACNNKDPGSNVTFPDEQQLSGDTSNAAYGKRLSATFFDQPCIQLARNLLGKYIVRISPEVGERLSGRIVETEAYVGIEDRASHSYGGRRTARNEAMYMPPGTSYVYNIYGIYTCINISSRGHGTAVLIRALEPTEGLDIMQKNRGLVHKSDKLKPQDLCGGPSKLTKALSIVKSNGDQIDLATCSYLWLEDGDQIPDNDIVSCSRIGIGNYAKEWTDKPLRFYIRGCPRVSMRCKAAEGATNT